MLAALLVSCEKGATDDPGKTQGDAPSASPSTDGTGAPTESTGRPTASDDHDGDGIDDSDDAGNVAGPSPSASSSVVPGSSGIGGAGETVDDAAAGVNGGAGATEASDAAGGAGGTQQDASAGGAAKRDAGPFVPLRECNSSDGSGCDPDELCLDIESDACGPGLDADCVGHCAQTLPAAGCDVQLAQCYGDVTCPALPGQCAEGLVLSIVDDCWGPCVPADCCACAQDTQCPLDDVACDLQAGRCTVPAAPEPSCLLPFEPGACATTTTVFAFIDGECQELAAGQCQGNDNRFFTLDECLRRCEGLPQQGPCPEGRVGRLTCLQCGGGGGCVEEATVCAKSCETNDDCDRGMLCVDAACGMYLCI